MEYNGKCIISVDWLSIYVSCLGKKEPAHGTIRDAGYGTQVYQFTEYYQINEKDVACLTWQPRSGALKKDTGIIKILNEYLYTEDVYTFCQNIMHDWGLVPLSVSRLDVCADFHRFWDYPNMNDFFTDFLNSKIWKIGKAKYKMIGEAEYLSDKQGYVLQGVQSAQHSFQYLRFGSNTSDVAAYLYNKSLEFREVKQKNYIIDLWQRNDMDVDKDVWRLEFSIKGEGIKIVDEETGNIGFDKLLIIKEKTLLRRLYAALYKKYWEFRVNDGQVRKDRMKKCNLLNIKDIPLSITKSPLSPDATIGDKRLIASMERVYNELRHAGWEQANVLKYSTEQIAFFKGLNAWYAKKYPTS